MLNVLFNAQTFLVEFAELVQSLSAANIVMLNSFTVKSKSQGHTGLASFLVKSSLHKLTKFEQSIWLSFGRLIVVLKSFLIVGLC